MYLCRVFCLGFFMLVGVLLASCGGPQQEIEGPAPIQPGDFALFPCGLGERLPQCTLVIAGGKRVLFGTPAGIGKALPAEHIASLDLVVLMSLRGPDLEGLDEVRNQSWRLGRETPLKVVGPRGTGAVAEALNRVFEQSDGLRIAYEGVPPGGYDAPLIEAVGVRAEATVIFDTGDVRIRADQGWAENRRGVFEVTYREDHQLMMERCGPEGKAQPHFRGSGQLDHLIWLLCEAEPGRLSWPIKEVVVLYRDDGDKDEGG